MSALPAVGMPAASAVTAAAENAEPTMPDLTGQRYLTIDEISPGTSVRSFSGTVELSENGEMRIYNGGGIRLFAGDYIDNGFVFTDESGIKYTFGTAGFLVKIADKNGTNTYSYKYDDNGIRTEKTVNGITAHYLTVDGRITGQYDGTDTLYFRYNADNSPIGFSLKARAKKRNYTIC